MRKLGLIFAGLSFILILSLASDLLNFVDIPSVILMFCLSFSIIFATYGEQATFYLKAPFNSKLKPTEQEYYGVLTFFQFVINLMVGIAAIAILISTIGILTNLDHPKSIGPSLATALLSSLYATIVISLMILPARTSFINQHRIKLSAKYKKRLKQNKNLSLKLSSLAVIPTCLCFGTLFSIF